MADSFTCPRCGRTSHHPDDVREGYCGACRDWTRGEITGPLADVVAAAMGVVMTVDPAAPAVRLLEHALQQLPDETRLAMIEHYARSLDR